VVIWQKEKACMQTYTLKEKELKQDLVKRCERKVRKEDLLQKRSEDLSEQLKKGKTWQ
jgi:hypothetical protein